MKLVDTNVLIYATNAEAIHHGASKRWLDHALSGGAVVGFAWLALIGFVRLTTNPTIFARPLGSDEAMDQVDAWLAAPSARVLQPGAGHAAALRRLLTSGAGGNLTNDAHLAALAIEHRASVVTFDDDFTRFDVKTERPS